MMNEEELREQNLRLKLHITSLEDALARQKDVRKVVGELSQKVEQQGRELAELRAAITDQDRCLAPEVTGLWEGDTRDDISDAEQNLSTAMRFDANKNRIWGSAGSDNDRWAEVARKIHAASIGSAKDAVAEAIRQGLAAKPIDQTDERLVHVVEEILHETVQRDYWARWCAKRILSAIAAAQQEAAK